MQDASPSAGDRLTWTLLVDRLTNLLDPCIKLLDRGCMLRVRRARRARSVQAKLQVVRASGDQEGAALSLVDSYTAWDWLQ